MLLSIQSSPKQLPQRKVIIGRCFALPSRVS